jgi:hypothetical protein
MVDSYYNSPFTNYYAGSARQRGSGFGALALGIGRTILPLARTGLRKLAPIALSMGKEFVRDIAPELLDAAITKRKPNKKAFATSAAKAVKKQIGRGVSVRKNKQRVQRRNVIGSRKKSKTQKVNSIIQSRRRTPRSRSAFFSRVQDD